MASQQARVVTGRAVVPGLSRLRELRLCLLVSWRPELSRRLVRLAGSYACRKCTSSNLDPHRLAMAGFLSGHFAAGPDYFAPGHGPRMAPAQALAHPAACGRRVVCQPVAAFELQHRDRIPLSFNGAAGAHSANCDLSGSDTNDAVRNCAAGIYRRDRSDCTDCCLFRNVPVAVTECDDEGESSVERIRSRANAASARRGDDFRGPDSRGQVLARRRSRRVGRDRTRSGVAWIATEFSDFRLLESGAARFSRRRSALVAAVLVACQRDCRAGPDRFTLSFSPGRAD